MASSKNYLQFILEQLSGIEGITHRQMMGEYLLYYRGKLFGGIYDDRFLVKMTSSAQKIIPEASQELPYDGAKPMLMVDTIEDKTFLKSLIEAIYTELPAPKKK